MTTGPVHARPADVLDALAGRRLIIVAGKGGVGRTTLAALLGLAAARRGRKTLVATTGHDDRLAWMLGASALPDVALEVAPGLSIQRLEPQTCIREYGALVLRSERLSGAVFDNGVVRRLLRAIPGLDDYAVLGKAWHEAIRARSYDCVVFDGPATGHLRFVLGVPQAILAAMPPGPLSAEAREVQTSFEDPALTQAVLVGLPEGWPLTELSELGKSLTEELRIHVGAMVVNGLWPAGLPQLQAGTGAEPDAREAAQVVARVAAVAARQRASLERWRASEAARASGVSTLVELPWRWTGLDGPADLTAFLAALEAQRAPGLLGLDPWGAAGLERQAGEASS